jgi:hypothetical protein
MVDDGWLRWLAERDKIRMLRGWCESGAPSRQKKEVREPTDPAVGGPFLGSFFSTATTALGRRESSVLISAEKKRTEGQSHVALHTRASTQLSLHTRG